MSPLLGVTASIRRHLYLHNNADVISPIKMVLSLQCVEHVTHTETDYEIFSPDKKNVFRLLCGENIFIYLYIFLFLDQEKPHKVQLI